MLDHVSGEEGVGESVEWRGGGDPEEGEAGEEGREAEGVELCGASAADGEPAAQIEGGEECDGEREPKWKGPVGEDVVNGGGHVATGSVETGWGE